MYRLKELDVRLPERGHVIKASEAGLLAEASNIIADAERQAAEILLAAQERYQEEERRGFEAGEARAAREAVARLVREQAVLDQCLDKLTEELARLASDSIRKVIGVVGEKELMRSFVTHAMRNMRSQKRIRLSVSTAQYEEVRAHVERVAEDFPEIELIDVQENPAFEDQRFLLEAETGRIEGSVEASLSQLDELLLTAISETGVIRRPRSVSPARREGRS